MSPTKNVEHMYEAASRGDSLKLDSILTDSPSADACLKALHLAVVNGHRTAVNVLLCHSAAVLKTDNKGNNALTLAVEYNQLQLIELLIRNLRSKSQYTRSAAIIQALNKAIITGNVEIVKFLCEYNIDINSPDDYGHIPLLTACKTNRIETVRYLIEEGANVSQKNSYGNTPLLISIEEGNLDIVKLLVTNNAELNNNETNCTPLHKAQLLGKTEIIQYLVSKGALDLSSDQGEFNDCQSNISDELIFEELNSSNTETSQFEESVTDCHSNISEAVDELSQNDKNCLLFKEIRNGNVDAVRQLISSGAIVNSRESNGSTPLHEAVKEENLDIYKMLCSAGACVNSTDNNGSTPLLMAAKQNNIIAETLLGNNAIVNMANINGNTPLFVAVTNNNLSLAKQLIACGADVNFKTSKGKSPLMSCDATNISLIELLVVAGANVNETDSIGRTLLHTTSETSNIDVMKILIENGCDINTCDKYCETPLHLACSYGNISAVTLLLESGVNPSVTNINGETPFEIASKKKYSNIVQVFPKQKKDVEIFVQPTNNNSNEKSELLFNSIRSKNIDLIRQLLTENMDLNFIFHGSTPLHEAVSVGDVQIIDMLCEAGVNMNSTDNEGRAPLMFSLDRDTVIIDRLLLKGADVNFVNNYGSTPLFSALKLNKVSLVEKLISHGAKVNYKNRSGRCPLLSCDLNNIYLITLLVNSGANVNDTDTNGFTLLHIAAANDKIKIIKLLFENDCNLNVRSNNLKTPLHLACGRGHIASVELLLNCGADTTVTDKDGYTPLDVASENNDTHIINLFSKYSNSHNSSNSQLNNQDNTTSDKLFKALVNTNLTTELNKNDSVFSAHVQLVISKEISDLSINGSSSHTPLKVTEKDICVNSPKVLNKRVEGNTQQITSATSDETETNSLNHAGTLDENTSNAMNEMDIALHQALSSVGIANFFQILRELISNGANVNSKDQNGDTVLSKATEIDNISSSVLKLFLKNGANVNTINKLGYTPLHLAVKRGNFKKVHLFLKHGADINIKSYAGTYPLLTAVANAESEEMKDIVDLLLSKNKTDLNVTNANGNTALHLATSYSDTAIVTALIEKGAKILRNDNNKTPFDLMSQRNMPILHFMNLIKQNEVKHSSEMNSTPLNSNSIFTTKSKKETKHGEEEKLHNANIHEKNEEGRNNILLHEAVNFADISSVKKLLLNGADVNCVDEKGNTVLGTAAEKGYIGPAILEILIQNGAHVNTTNSSGCSPLYLAVSKKNIIQVKMLLKYGADINLKNTAGKYPLLAAITNSSQKDVKPLVDLLLRISGIDVNIADANGDTALHFAVVRGDTDVIKSLVDKGAKIVCNKKNETPFDLVSNKNKIFLMNLFKSNETDRMENEAGNHEKINKLNKGNTQQITASCATNNLYCTSDSIKQNQEKHSAKINLTASNSNCISTTDNKMVTKSEFRSDKSSHKVDIFKKNKEKSLNKTDILLHKAVSSGNTSLVEELVSKGANVNYVDKEGNTLLGIAAEKGHIGPAILEILIQNGAHINRTNSLGSSPLYLAVDKKNITKMRLLLNYGADIDLGNSAGNYPLLTAITNATHQEMKKLVVDLLLCENGINVNVADANGDTALHLAVVLGDTDIIKYLLDKGANIVQNKKNKTIFDLLKKSKTDNKMKNKGDHRIIKKHVKENIQQRTASKPTNNLNCTLLHQAIKTGDLKKVEYLLKQGADVNVKNSDGNYPLLIAVADSKSKNMNDIVNLLLSNSKTDLNIANANGNTALHVAVSQSNIDIIKVLIEKGAKILHNKNNKTPFDLMSSQKNIPIMNLKDLVKQNEIKYSSKIGLTPSNSSCISTTNGKSETKSKWSSEKNCYMPNLPKINKKNSLSKEDIALHKAILSGDTSLVKELLSKGANANSIDEKGDTLLCIAAKKGHIHPAILEFLIQNGARVNTKNSLGCSPLYLAVSKKNIIKAKMLLKYGADINLRNTEGKYPLLAAITNSSNKDMKPFVDFLLNESGIDVNVADTNGDTALHLAFVLGDTDLIKSLVDKGAIIVRNKENKIPFDLFSGLNKASVINLLKKTETDNKREHKSDHGERNTVNINTSSRRDKDINISLGVTEKINHVDSVEILNKHVEGNTQHIKSTISDETETNSLDKINILDENTESIMNDKDIALHEALSPDRIVIFFHILEDLLSNGANVNSKDKNGDSVLSKAAENNDILLPVLEFFIKKGANVDTTNNLGYTPLHLAVKKSNIIKVRYLLKQGADINIKNSEGHYPLLTAVANAKNEEMKGIVELLLSNKGTDVNVINAKGNTALHLAASRSNTDIFKALIEKGVKILHNNNNKTPFDLMSSLHMPTIYLKNLDTQNQVNHSSEISLTPSISNCNFTTDGKMNTKLEFKTDEDLQKANIDEKIEQNCKSEKDIQLHKAVSSGDKSLVEALVSEGANVNYVDEEGNTLLGIAAEKGHIGPAISEILIQNGACVNTTNSSGCSPLFLAVSKKNITKLKLLIKYGADVNLGNSVGNYPLLAALTNANHPEMKPLVDSLLCDSGIDVNVADTYGNTAFHLAVVLGDADIIKTLVDKRAKIVRNKENKTPFDLTSEQNKMPVKDMAPTQNNIIKTENCAEDKIIKNDEQLNSNSHTNDDKSSQISEENRGSELLNHIKKNQSIDVQFLKCLSKEEINYCDEEGQTPLHEACRLGNFKSVEMLCEAGANINCCDKNENTPLLHSVLYKVNKSIVKYLVAQKADVDKINKTNHSPLLLATKTNSLKNVKTLLEAGADVNKKNSKGKFPLIIAVDVGNIKIINKLLTSNIDINNTDKKGMTALHKAAELGNLEAVTVLIKNGANVNALNKKGMTPLQLAEHNGQRETIKLLNSNTNISCVETLNSSVETTITLSQPINKSNFTANNELNTKNSHLVCSNQLEENVQLINAVKDGNLTLVTSLLKECTDVNLSDKNGHTALHEAVICSAKYKDEIYNKITLQLISAGADVNYIDISGDTPLMLAVKHGCKSILDTFILHGVDTNKFYNGGTEKLSNARVDINQRNFNGEFPLLIATNNALNKTTHGIDIVWLLIKKGANIDNTDYKGNTSLHQAVVKNSPQLTKLLITNGAVVNCCNNNLITPLHLAATEGNYDTVKMLLDYGADASCCEVNGKTPLALAQENNRTAVAKLLASTVKNCAEENDFTASNNEYKPDVDSTNMKKTLKQYIQSVASSSVANVHISDNIVSASAQNKNKSCINQNVVSGHPPPLHAKSVKIIPTLSHAEARNCNLEAVNNRTDLYSIDKHGNTPFSLATQHQHNTVVDLLALVNVSKQTSEASGSNTPKQVQELARKSVGLNQQPINIVSEQTSTSNKCPYLVNFPFNFTDLLNDLLNGNRCSEQSHEELHKSVYNSKLELLKMVAPQKPFINYILSDGNTPLICAIKQSCIPVVKILIKKGADVNIPNTYPVHCAVLTGNVAIVELLFAAGASFNRIDKEGHTPLTLSIKMDNLVIVNFLLQYMKHYKIQSPNNQRALYFAVTMKNFSAVKLILDSNIEIMLFDKEGRTVLHEAILENKYEIIKPLLVHGFNPNMKSFNDLTALHVASMRKLVDIVKLLLNYGADVNAQTTAGYTPLYEASNIGHIETMEILLEFGANVNIKTILGETALHPATKEKHLLAIQLLLKHGTDVNVVTEAGYTALHHAAYNGDANIISMLIEKGAHANIQSDRGSSALHIAVERDNVEAVEALLENGVITDVTATGENVPLHDAVRCGYLHTMGLLLSEGANIEFKNSRGETALHIAVMMNNVRAVDFLLNNGADVNTRTELDYCTPLHLAARRGYASIISLLLKHGADINAELTSGATPLDEAVRSKHKFAVNMLKLAKLL